MPAPGSVTLASIRTQAQQRSDMVNSTFISTTEWNSYISNSYKELYDILVGAYSGDYYVATAFTFASDGTNDSFALPTDFYKLLGLDLQLGSTGDSWVTIRPFNFADRNRYAVPNFQSFYGITNLRYRLRGSSLWLTPIPSGGQTFRVWYIPEPASLVNDTDTLDGISGWEEYIIVDAAIKAKDKEESDVSILMAQKQALLIRIESMAQNRDAANPSTVADTQWSDLSWPTESGSGSF